MNSLARKFLDEKEDTLLNPNLIIEVLSDSTESYDRGKKFQMYRDIETLQEYVLVSCHQKIIEVYKKVN
jgi:Uma2 family endonuclease